MVESDYEKATRDMLNLHVGYTHVALDEIKKSIEKLDTKVSNELMHRYPAVTVIVIGGLAGTVGILTSVIIALIK